MNFGIRVEQNEVVIGPQGSGTIAAFNEAQILIIFTERYAGFALETLQKSFNGKLRRAIVDNDHLTLQCAA